MDQEIKLKKAKTCMNCKFFDHEYMEDGNCMHEKQKGRQTNGRLICKLYKKNKELYNRQ